MIEILFGMYFDKIKKPPGLILEKNVGGHFFLKRPGGIFFIEIILSYNIKWTSLKVKFFCNIFH